MSFDPSAIQYGSNYENSLHYSQRFSEYASQLAERLVNRYRLYRKTVIEIACGRGEFLASLCKLGDNRGLGFDPSHNPEAISQPGLTILPEYYNSTYSDVRADMICCRHALEHISTPSKFLQHLAGTVGDRSTPVYFEVPNVLFTLRDLAVWDIIYEHCSYFSEYSLREVFRRNGFEIDEIRNEFGGQYLGLYGTAGEGPLVSIPPRITLPHEMIDLIGNISLQYRSKLENWNNTLNTLHAQGKRIALWGAGSKGVCFLNSVAATEAVGCLVDLNPRKHDLFTPCTGHSVRAPEYLISFQPDVLVVMNPMYIGEIRHRLSEMQLHPQIVEDVQSVEARIP